MKQLFVALIGCASCDLGTVHADTPRRFRVIETSAKCYATNLIILCLAIVFRVQGTLTARKRVSGGQKRCSMSSFNSTPLRIEGLVKRFGSVTAVDGIGLDVRAGECFGLLGPNGAGKSTLIRSIVGRVRPNSGRILIFGETAESAAARAALGWVPQELAIYPRLTSRENLESFGRYHGLKGDELEQAITWCLEWAALADRDHEVVNHLSGGMKRRLNMAAGLIHRPRIVLMDEPTVGVDPQSRLRIFEMIEALRREGMSVIYTTHYMEEAERLCDRIAIIDHGLIIAL